jgi:hypothetical protein
VVAAKSFVAAALLGLVITAQSLGDAPTIRISSADQAKANAGLLHRADLGAGWVGGPVKTSPLTPPDCPGFNPKSSDLVVSGHANARYRFQQVGVELDQDVEVFSSPAAVQTDFARSISPALGRCLEHQLGNLTVVADVSVARIPFPRIGSVSAVFRADLVVKTGKGLVHLVTDYVFFGRGRVEYEFTVSAPEETRDQLVRFEFGLAQILLRRAAQSA